MSSPPTQPRIPIVCIGVHRFMAPNAAAFFEKTPYELVAWLDLVESPKSYQYTPQNLGTVLHSLYPRPRVLLTGTAVERIVPEVREVWKEYVEGALKEEGGEGRAVYVPLSDFYSADGPPAPGTFAYALRQLDDVFRPESK